MGLTLLILQVNDRQESNRGVFTRKSPPAGLPRYPRDYLAANEHDVGVQSTQTHSRTIVMVIRSNNL